MEQALICHGTSMMPCLIAISSLVLCLSIRISTTGYSATGSLSDTLHRFYGMDPSDTAQSVDPDTAQASPVMEAHVPADKTREEIVAELLETELNDGTNATPGYKKMAAYSLLKGGLNINSTAYWGYYTRGSNGEFDVKSYDGSSDSRTAYLGFPQSSSPALWLALLPSKLGRAGHVWPCKMRLTTWPAGSTQRLRNVVPL